MNDIYAKANALCVDLAQSEIPNILNQSNQSDIVRWTREWLSSFFSMDQSELSRGLLERYAEVHSVMTGITFYSNEDDIHTRVIQSLASAKKCYSYGEYLACIELCALHGEMLVNYLCTADREKLETVRSELCDNDKNHINQNIDNGAFFADKINQLIRLRWLLSANIIDSNDKKVMEKIHGVRIKYFHKWRTGTEDIKKDALNIIASVSSISAKFLELYESPNNIDRIKNFQ